MSTKIRGPERPGTWFANERSTMTRWQRWAAILVIGLLLWAGIYTLRNFMPALGWAVIFAVSLWPWYSRAMARWPQHQKLLLPAIATVIVLLAFVIPLIIVIVPLVHDTLAALEWIQQANVHGISPPDFLFRLPFADQTVSWWRSQLGHPGALSDLTLHSSLGLPAAEGKHLLAVLLHRLILVGFMLITLFFLLRDGERVIEGLKIGSRRAFGPAGEHVGMQIVQAIRGTVNGLVAVGFSEGVILGVIYAGLGVPHPALFGLLTALLSAIPFGAVAAFVAAAALLAANGAVTAATAIIVIGAVIVFVADHFVRPVLIGGATRLPFLWILLGILGGVEVWGIIGLVLGPALMAALMLLWREWIGAQEGPLNPFVQSE